MLWGCPGNKDLTIQKLVFQWRWFSWNPPVVFEVDVMGAPWTALTMVDFTRFVWQNIYIYSVYMVEYNLVVYYNYDHITINHYFLDIGVTFLPASVGMFPEQYQWSLGSKTLRSFVALGETSGNKCMFWFMMIYDDFIICPCDFMNTNHNYVIVTC